MIVTYHLLTLEDRAIVYDFRQPSNVVGKPTDIGVMDSDRNIRNKLSRGKFTAVFLIQCLEAIRASSLRLSDG